MRAVGHQREESGEAERPRRGGRDKDRSRGKDRGPRGRGVHKADIDGVDTDRVEPVEAEPAAKVETVKNERRAENTKPQQRSNHGRPYPANDDNRERRQRYHRDQDDGPTPVGFGDDIPAFMLIVANAKA